MKVEESIYIKEAYRLAGRRDREPPLISEGVVVRHLAVSACGAQ